MRLLKNATNMFGAPVDPGLQECVAAFMAAPSFETWDSIYSIILTAEKRCGCRRGCTTIWQAVIAVDPSFPRSGRSGRTPSERWSRHPDAMTVARAIKHATGG
jgi:hypothetical protein